MRDKDFDDYSGAHLARLKRALADIYSGFGKEAENFYLVGGLVPDLLVSNKLAYLKEYLGTLDIDIAVKLVVGGHDVCRDFYGILRSLGFEKQKTSDGRDVMSHSFLKYESGYKPIVLDLLTDDRLKPKSDKLAEIAPNIDAVKFRGVYLVFDDFITRDIKADKKKIVKIKIPNIIPFLTLKAFAYMDEGNRIAKDAFDIWYTIVNFKDGPDSVRGELAKYKKNKDVSDAFEALHRLFADESSFGVRDVSHILTVRYGLEMAFANKEVIYPIKRLRKCIR